MGLPTDQSVTISEPKKYFLMMAGVVNAAQTRAGEAFTVTLARAMSFLSIFTPLHIPNVPELVLTTAAQEQRPLHERYSICQEAPSIRTGRLPIPGLLRAALLL